MFEFHCVSSSASLRIKEEEHVFGFPLEKKEKVSCLLGFLLFTDMQFIFLYQVLVFQRIFVGLREHEAKK